MKLSLLVALSFCVTLASCTFYHSGFMGNMAGTYGSSVMNKGGYGGYGTSFMGSGFGAMGGLFHMIIFLVVFVLIINVLFSTTNGISGFGRIGGGGYGKHERSDNEYGGYKYDDGGY